MMVVYISEKRSLTMLEYYLKNLTCMGIQLGKKNNRPNKRDESAECNSILKASPNTLFEDDDFTEY